MLNRLMAVVLMYSVASVASDAAEMLANPAVTVATNAGGQKILRDIVLSAKTYPGFVPGSVAATLWISNHFAGFVPGTLADVVWRGFHTNGRSPRIWQRWYTPPGWPAKPPVLRWNTNSLIWGMRGMTAISQVWQEMGPWGQLSITALTRRHGYLRGHSMGPSGLQPGRVGDRIWFCTRDNQVIERKVQLFVVRFMDPGYVRDYSIALFDADLPTCIEPMRVADPVQVRRKYLFLPMDHKPVFRALQGGFVSAGILDWDIPVHGGDSGAPSMLPLPGELVFLEGVSTDPPSAGMQADMDMLSRQAGLDPRKYQMQWVDLDGYPNP